MVIKIILTILVIVACFIGLKTMEQNVAPQHATDLVITGVNDTDLMANKQAQMRIEQDSQNHLDWIFYVVGTGLCLVIWRKDIFKNEEEK